MSLITVVGAGPVGLKIANLLKQEGLDVSAIEEHPIVGKPTNCSGLISRSGIEELGISLGDSLVNEIKGARIFAPSNEKLEIRRNEAVAYVVDRYKFDQLFYAESKKLGLDLRLNTKLLDIRGSNLFVESSGRGELMKSSIIVGADGPGSIVRHIMKKEARSEFFAHSIQAKADGSFEKDIAEVYLGKFAPGFFAWVIPESESRARIGLGATAGNDVEDLFRQFIIDKQIKATLYNKTSALIPCGPPMKPVLSEKILIAGDAAFQTKATTGGGIVTGLHSAKACSEAIAEHLKHGRNLADYEKKLAPVYRELNMHWKARAFANSAGIGEISSLFAKAKKAGIEEFLSREGDMDRPSRFVGKLAAKPSFWFMLPTLLRIMRS